MNKKARSKYDKNSLIGKRIFELQKDFGEFVKNNKIVKILFSAIYG